MKTVRILTVVGLLVSVVGCATPGGVAGSKGAERAPLPALVKVPAGTALMGYGSGIPSSPVHAVTITEDFEIGKFEVTNEEYAGMLNAAQARGLLVGDYAANGVVRNAEGERQPLMHLGERLLGIHNPIQYDPAQRRFVVEAGKERHPVVYVTWYGAVFYCNVLSEQEGLVPQYDLKDWSIKLVPPGPGYRLPTEAEWEYVARHDANNMDPERRKLIWGWKYEPNVWPTPDDPDIHARCNYYQTVAAGGTKPVGQYESGKTDLGVYDMAGNVSEWVQDYYARYLADAQTNPVENTSGVYRQRRGGGWLQYANNFPYTFYHTDTNYEYVYYVDFGFRVVKSGMPLQAIGVAATGG